MILGVDPPTNPGEDKGAERETRRRPCIRRTWCVESLDHDGPCVEVVSEPVPRSDFGPRRKR